MRDEIFGCLNPLLITILQGDSKLLNTILEKWGYPYEFSSFMTPIEFSFHNEQLSCLETICKYLIKNNQVKKIWFTLKEFKILLKSQLTSCHEVLSQILTIREEMRFPALAYMKNDITIGAKKNLMKFLLKLQKGGKQTIEEDFTIEVKDTELSKERNKKLKKVQSNKIKTEVDILTVPFKYDYSIGSEDSVNFLSYYSKSKSKKFIKSEWKQLIDNKWLSVKLFNMFLACYFFGFLIFTTIVIVFEEGIAVYANSLMFIISLFMVLEIIQITAYAFFDIKSYFRDIWNIVDWTLFAMTILYPMTLQKDAFKDGSFNKIGGVVILIVVYYRGFSYLRIFGYFTSLVEIINSVVSKFI
jgi:hypothetical protein